MLLKELVNHLGTLGFPLSYHHFEGPPQLPYLVYLFTDSDDMNADNRNYVEISNVDIELYTDNKDLQSEKIVEDKLKEIEIPYKKYEVYIQEEKMYQVLYEIQII